MGFSCGRLALQSGNAARRARRKRAMRMRKGNAMKTWTDDLSATEYNKVEKTITTGKKGEADYKEKAYVFALPATLAVATRDFGDKVFERFTSQVVTDYMNDAREELRGRVNKVEAAKAEMAEESIKRLMGAPVNLAFPMAFQAIMGRAPVEADFAKYGVAVPTA